MLIKNPAKPKISKAGIKIKIIALDQYQKAHAMEVPVY